MIQPVDNDRLTILSPRYEPETQLGSISADRVLSIVEAAEQGDTRDLFSLYRDIIATDGHIRSELLKRKGAVLSDPITLIPWDKANPDDCAAREACFPIIDSPQFLGLVDHLLNVAAYPVAVAEKVFSVDPRTGLYTLSQTVPVNFALLDFRGAALRIYDTDEDGRPRPESYVADTGRYIVHRGMTMPVPDTWGGPMRAVLFWWLLRNMGRQWWADFLERFGVPFLKGTFRAGDKEARSVLTAAFQQATRLGAIVVSDATSAEIVHTATSDASDSHERFIELCNREISRVLLGQTLSGNVQSTGELGGGQATLQGAVRDDIRAMDAKLLAGTIARQLFDQVLRLNGLRGHAPILVFGSESDRDLARTVQLVQALAQSGLEPDDEGVATLSERVGFGLRRKQSTAAPAPFAATLAARPNPTRRPAALRAALEDGIAAFDSELAWIIQAAKSPQEALDAARQYAAGKGRQLLERDLRAVLSLYLSAGYAEIPMEDVL